MEVIALALALWKLLGSLYSLGRYNVAGRMCPTGLNKRIDIPFLQQNSSEIFLQEVLTKCRMGLLLLLLLFLIFCVLVANPKKYFTRWRIPLVVC